MAPPIETLPAVKISLKVKAFALLSLVMLAIVTVLGWAFLHHTQETFKTARQQYALTVGKHLAYHSQQGVLTENNKLLPSVIDGIWQEESILGVLIVNAQGHLIMQRYKALVGAEPLSLTWQQALERVVGEVLPVTTPLVHARIVDGTKVYHVAVPMQTMATGESQPASKGVDVATRSGAQGITPLTPALTAASPGSVHLFFSSEPISMHLHRTWRASVALPLALLLFGLLAVWLCLHYTLAPLQAMTRAACRIAAGDLSQRIVVPSHDEIGVLASIVNRMTSSLAQRAEEQAQRGGALTALHSLGEVLNVTLDREQHLPPVLDAIVQHFGYDHVHLFLMEADRQALVPTSAAGKVPALAALQAGCIPLRDGRELHARVALHGKPILVHQGQYTPEEVYYSQGSVVDLGSLLVVPVQAEGRILGVLSVAHISSHRRLTEADQRLVMSLANLIAPALAHALASQEIARLQTDLQQQRDALRQAKDNAAAASSTKTRFLANISHEIRTPMNGVMGMVALLLGTSLTAKQRRFAETIRRSGEALLILINDILDFSKIEAGKLELETIDFDLRQTVEDVVELLTEGAHHKGLELVCDIQPTIPTALRGDPLRFCQILTNLLGNAIKFTSHGEVSVHITRVSEEPHHIVLRCAVQDTGIGIAADVQTRIFDAFSQADGSTTRQYGGTGLGLAITKQLVNMMHGTLHVDSQPGHGSTFWFTARFDLQPAQPHLSHSMHLSLQGLHALIIDDHATVCTALARQLQVLGITSHQATTSAQALTMVRMAMTRGRSYDLACVDMQLPDIDGTEFAMALRTEARLPHLPLIMLTPLGHYERDARLSGVVEYLAKPIRRAQLYMRLIAVMSASGTIPLPQDLLLIHANERTMTFHGRVLLAEDNLVNQEVAREILASLGCQIDLAANGEEAVVMASRTAYDVIFMDCQMPVMDGFAATRAIRTNEALQRQKHIPVIALTAHAAEEDRKQCLAMGMDDYLSKPFSPEALSTVLRRWLRPHAQRPPTLEETTEPQRSETTSHHAAASPGVAPIDIKVLDTLRALPRGAASLKQVLRTYLKATPSLVAALQDAISRGDASAVRQAAHSLRSSSAAVGALSLAALCKALEDMGRANTLTTAHTLLGRLEAEYAAVCAALERELPHDAA